MVDISPAQAGINAARRKAARTAHIANLQSNVNDLQTRIGNCERRQEDPLKASQLPGLREQLSLAAGALQAAQEHDERMTAGVIPKSDEQIAAERQLVLEREVRRNREKNGTPNWPPATAIAAGVEATAKRGRGRPRKIAP